MRVMAWNVNGLRAAVKKGMTAHLARLAPDVVVLEEIRCRVSQLPEPSPVPEGWHAEWGCASRPGYAGVAIWSRLPMVRLDPGPDAPDPDGRLVYVGIGGWRIAGLYLPSGSAGPDRQAAKEAWMERFRPWLDRIRPDPVPTLVIGDWNLAHRPHDVASWRRAGVISGFLPHERAWLGDVLASGWDDAVRRLAGDRPGPYTYWSNFGRARAEDRGWRIDLAMVNPAGSERVRGFHVDREAGLACSDHAPVVVDLAE
jgi:exodeoxyribonuclease III